MEDKEIVELYLSRSEQAVALTQEKYGGALLRFAAGFLASDEDCEECVNEALFKAWRSIPPNRPDNLLAYLKRLTRCTAFDMADRRRAAKRTAELVSLTAELEECIPDGAADLEPEGSELKELMEGFLDTLPEDKRWVFVRRYWHGYSIRMIAAETGAGEGKLRTQLARTRKKLAQYLKERGLDK
ncbi:MAG: RNA polymerase sigma factor [Ruminococcus sp.]|nr:RNA polymerase sigma factor [Ruminococcus sp.]